jgi:hypothetical protein
MGARFTLREACKAQQVILIAHAADALLELARRQLDPTKWSGIISTAWK